MAVLQLANGLWKIDQRNRNADEIARQAGKIYDKCVSFIESFDSVGKSLAPGPRPLAKSRQTAQIRSWQPCEIYPQTRKTGQSQPPNNYPLDAYPGIENGSDEDDETEDDS